MSDKLNIDQLINSHMGEAEIPPSQGVWKGVRRKLRWKQFLHFNPGKPNIYYLGGLLIVGAGTIYTLWTDSDNAKPMAQSENQISQIQEEHSSEEQAALKIESENVMDPLQQRVGNRATSPEDHNLEADQPLAESLMESTGSSLQEVVNLPEETSSINQPGDRPVQNTIVTYFTSSMQSGCAPFTVQFTNQSVNSTSSYWTFGTKEKSKIQNPVYTFEEAGKFTVTLTAENNMGQASSYQQIIEVYPAPRAEFTIEEGFEGVEGHVVLNLVNYSTRAYSFAWDQVKKHNLTSGRWTTNELQPSIKLKDLQPASEQIRLVAENEYGCTDTSFQSIPVVVETSKPKMKFPTAFSPNPMGPVGGSFSPTDKRTDLFHPLFTEVPMEYNLRIYTRRGELVFETRDIYSGWDGYIQQERSMGGVYVWMVEGTWEAGEEFKLHGDVTLLWKEIW